MKQICISLFVNTNNDYNKEYIRHILKQGNSLITIPPSEYEEHKLDEIIKTSKSIVAYFHSKFNTTIKEIDIKFCEFDIDLFCESIKTIVDITFENVKELSIEQFDELDINKFDDSDFAKMEVTSLIENVLMKYKYNEPINLIYLISDIFKCTLTSHKLRNGNKRMSSMLLANILYYQGIFLKGSIKYKHEKFWKVNEDKFIEFINEYDNICTSNNFDEKDLDLLLKIYQWIYDSVYISLNFNLH